MENFYDYLEEAFCIGWDFASSSRMDYDSAMRLVGETMEEVIPSLLKVILLEAIRCGFYWRKLDNTRTTEELEKCVQKLPKEQFDMLSGILF